MGVLMRLIIDYGLRVAIAVLAICASYVVIRYVFQSRISASSDSETNRSRKQGPTEGPLEPEVCSMCSGPLDENLKCEYCGTRHR